MIDAKETIERAKVMLGAPVRAVELTDEQMACLIDDAYETFHLYATIADLSRSKHEQIERYWVRKYFYALCKETLAIVRGKFEGKIGVPGSDLKLDYESLQNQSENEKRILRHLILQDKDSSGFNELVLAFYVNVGNMSHNDVETFIGELRNKLNGNDNFVKYFIPIYEGETRIECINSANADTISKETIEKLNTYLQKLIEDEKQ